MHHTKMDLPNRDTMCMLFARTPRVFQRAYLARVSFAEPGVSSVALCVRNRDDIEQTLLKGFKHMFGGVSRGANEI